MSLPQLPKGSGEWVWREAALDDVASMYERRWGVDRLPRLVPADLRARFQAACDMRDAEWPNADAARKDALAAMMARAWAALEAAALAAGHAPLPNGCFEVALDGDAVGAIACDAEHAQALRLRAKAEGRAVDVWTLAEVAAVMRANSAVSAIKAAFPGAEVKGAAPRFAGPDAVPELMGE